MVITILFYTLIILHIKIMFKQKENVVDINVFMFIIQQQETYMNEDKIQLIGEFEKLEGREDIALLNISIEINGQRVAWSHVDAYSIGLYWNNHTPIGYRGFAHSAFVPFSCSCGVPSCNDIWDGIYVKKRKRSVEWRANKEDGYTFLPKQFYSFDRKQYEKACNDFLFWLKMKACSDCDLKMCVDPGHYKGGETTVDEFFQFLEREKNY